METTCLHWCISNYNYFRLLYSIQQTETFLLNFRLITYEGKENPSKSMKWWTICITAFKLIPLKEQLWFPHRPLTLLKIKNFEKRKQQRKQGIAFGTKVFFLNSLRLYGHPSTAFVSLVLHFTEKVEQQQHGARRQKKIMAKTVHYLWEWGFVLEYKGIKRHFSISDDNLEDWHEVDCSVSITASLD